eukprot:TRINITY_DN8638_c0_g1_i3.p1 TRINITY_DN8638_c0_g1~~TRINITY_DN8638_c0_g1_i3.p1  ORF type:complete len:326 (+),score=126.30 TRINITY_DN8638_c0_g1_i3:419-1396(+)
MFLWILFGLFAAIVGFITFKVRQRGNFPAPKPQESVVVITGCDSGIGFHSTIRLLNAGFDVVASTYTPGGKHDLEKKAAEPSCKGKLYNFPLDITNNDSIDQFRSNVEEVLRDNNKKLAAIVNNAGIALPGPLEVQPVPQFERQMQVNLTGHVAVTQHFLPLIRRDKGRIINTASIAGRVAGAGMGAYACSKFAMEAFSDTLRQEVFQFGVSVSVIEPGFTQTPLVRSASVDYERNWDVLAPNARSLYKAQYESGKRMMPSIYAGASPVDNVAKAVEHAVTASRPKTRYLVGVDANILAIMAMFCPDRLRDAIAEAPDWIIAKKK